MTKWLYMLLWGVNKKIEIQRQTKRNSNTTSIAIWARRRSPSIKQQSLLYKAIANCRRSMNTSSPGRWFLCGLDGFVCHVATTQPKFFTERNCGSYVTRWERFHLDDTKNSQVCFLCWPSLGIRPEGRSLGWNLNTWNIYKSQYLKKEDHNDLVRKW